ncbi:uncharacterized protein LOC134812289 isoform X1 [Bolinopsis microptera]|uniref:uncharacterized protein LOC134812289 isoform X1 n=1 Tax=Bolinopsis microptera TaxID=2820187 RepID=UPI003078DB20
MKRKTSDVLKKISKDRDRDKNMAIMLLILLVFEPVAGTLDCRERNDLKGKAYRGKISVTKFGNICLRWDSQHPIQHTSITPEKSPTADLEENYCRNADQEPGPWCYNSAGTSRFELCDVPICPEWVPVPVDIDPYIDHDLERTPLKIKTDSETGSEELIRIFFYSEQRKNAGRIDIRDQQYRLGRCMADFHSLDTVPSGNEKKWEITKVTIASDVRMTIQCNGEIVKEFQMSSCDYGTWRQFWLQEVKLIRFGLSDTASDYIYYSPAECTGLKTNWYNMKTDTQFPILAKTAFVLSCNKGYELTGDRIVTCTKDTEFAYSTEPKCEDKEVDVTVNGEKMSRQYLGCWRDSGTRAIQPIEKKHDLLRDNYVSRTDAVNKCLKATLAFGYTVFAVQNGGWCASAEDAEDTYKKYGRSGGCGPDGEGGGWANDVYKIKQPVCIEFTVDHGQVSPRGPVKENTVVRVTCSNLYVLTGVYEVTCQPGGVWSAQPECTECGMNVF